MAVKDVLQVENGRQYGKGTELANDLFAVAAASYQTNSINQVHIITRNSEQRDLNQKRGDPFLIVETQLRISASRKSAYRVTLSRYCRQRSQNPVEKECSRNGSQRTGDV